MDLHRMYERVILQDPTLTNDEAKQKALIEFLGRKDPVSDLEWFGSFKTRDERWLVSRYRGI